MPRDENRRSIRRYNTTLEKHRHGQVNDEKLRKMYARLRAQNIRLLSDQQHNPRKQEQFISVINLSGSTAELSDQQCNFPHCHNCQHQMCVVNEYLALSHIRYELGQSGGPRTSEFIYETDKAFITPALKKAYHKATGQQMRESWRFTFPDLVEHLLLNEGTNQKTLVGWSVLPGGRSQFEVLIMLGKDILVMDGSRILASLLE